MVQNGHKQYTLVCKKLLYVNLNFTDLEKATLLDKFRKKNRKYDHSVPIQPPRLCC